MATQNITAGLPLDDLRSIVESLDEVNTYANGIGELKSCSIEFGLSGRTILAMYEDNEWSIAPAPAKRGRPRKPAAPKTVATLGGGTTVIKRGRPPKPKTVQDTLFPGADD